MNVEAACWRGLVVKSLAYILKKHFDAVVALPTAAPPNTLGNVVLLTSNHRLEIPEEMLGHSKHYLHDDYMHWYILQLNHAWDNRSVLHTDNILVLPDDLNPVDSWGEAINLTSRKQLHSYFGENGLNW